MARDPASETLAVPATPPTHEPSVLARGTLLAYLLLIIYASLYPFAGWELLGIPFEKYIFEPIPPRYWTWFDVATNVAGYVPLGVLAVYSCYPGVRGVLALLLATLLGTLVSGSMEAIQSFLPTRVTSNMDFLANSGGALIGACIGVATCRAVLEHSRLRHLRHQWFTPVASRGIVLIMLWPFAQIYPQSYLFGNGQLLPVFSDWISMLSDVPVDISAWLRQGIQPTATQYWLLEIVITSCSTAAVLLVFASILRDKASRFLLLLGLLLSGLGIKALSAALMFKPHNAFIWLSEGAQLGLAAGLIVTLCLLFLPANGKRYAALILLLTAFITINIAPANPYFTATLDSWVQGKFLNFNGAAECLSLVWPLLAFWFLLHWTHRVKRN